MSSDRMGAHRSRPTARPGATPERRVARPSRAGGDSIEASNQRALRGLAKDLLGRSVGDRLLTTAQYQQDFQVGAGTIQKALGILGNRGAVRLRPAGHRGTFIEYRNLGLLWQFAGLDSISISMSPPGALEHHGLSSALMTEFSRLGVPATRDYVRGAEQRLRLLDTAGCDIAVVSSGAAQPIHDDPRWQILDLGDRTYFSTGSLGVLKRRTGHQSHGPLRVGIDRLSPDHEQLTLAEFAQQAGVTYVQCAFTKVPRLILDGSIDIAVWHKVETLVPLELMDLEMRPFRSRGAEDLAVKISKAYLVCHSDNTAAVAVLGALTIGRIIAEQRRFVEEVARTEDLQGAVWLD